MKKVINFKYKNLEIMAQLVKFHLSFEPHPNREFTSISANINLKLTQNGFTICDSILTGIVFEKMLNDIQYQNPLGYVQTLLNQNRNFNYILSVVNLDYNFSYRVEV